MTTKDYIIQGIVHFLVTSGLLAAIVYFGKNYMLERLKGSIKYDYDKQLEHYKTELLTKQKAVLVAELIAEWISYPEDRKRLNQLTLEAFMWLPKETALKLSAVLAHNSSEVTAKHLITEVRDLLLGEEEAIDPQQVIIFPEKRVSESYIADMPRG